MDISFDDVYVKSPIGNELVAEEELSKPTRKLTKKQLNAILKASNEIHTRLTVKMPSVKG